MNLSRFISASRRTILNTRYNSMMGLMGAQHRGFATLSVGDKLPCAKVSVVTFNKETGFTNSIVNTSEYLEGKNVVIVGYPGAFTPTCMATHIPGYIGLAE